MLAGYQPILEEELKRAKDPERLKKELLASTPNCEEEMALAQRIFERFSTPELATRLLPPEAQAVVGSIEQSRWCLLHIRCCLIFGWLICRRPRNFRVFVYYLYRYWLCVRQVIGRPVSRRRPPRSSRTSGRWQSIAADAYRPYLTDQLATVEFPVGIPDEVIAGKIDCDDAEGLRQRSSNAC